MKTISKDALRNMLRRKEGWVLVPDGVKDLLTDVVYKQLANGTWRNGNPETIFIANGYYCVRYQNGMWWHYDLIHKTWF
ncbi:hypothetical protein ACE418_01255 [Megasphaera sp. WILCCON 0056]|uniref:hypothetical protein n=1 Tax=Megasphaera sp. WILCCON 0056 TaxID=3345340 RepID=UPI003A80E7FA